ncbi:MAG: hypothetical protein K5639_03295, partial [Eubacterium sp.]|nr:hypothetical protein [Eubacterium sp.]
MVRNRIWKNRISICLILALLVSVCLPCDVTKTFIGKNSSKGVAYAKTKTKATATPKPTKKPTATPKVTKKPTATPTAAPKVKLSKTKLSVTIGKTGKISMKNTKKNVMWSIEASGTSYASIKSYTKNTVTVKGLKKGKASLIGTVGNKSYICSVSVKKYVPKPTMIPAISASPKPTKIPAATATSKPTTKPTSSSRPKASATPVSPKYTIAPDVTIRPDKVSIGHASINERGTVCGSIAGDQTGREVYIREWYEKGWNKLVRAKNSDIANGIAKAMEQACKNNNIGYAQDTRDTCFREAEKVNWKINKIKTLCNADCSSLVRVCVNAAFYALEKKTPLQLSDSFYTGNMASKLKKLGEFKVYTADKYVKSDKNLKRGD